MDDHHEGKDCGELTPGDFREHPIWGFDLSAEEEHAETWVRPYSFSHTPKETDTLFVAAQLTDAKGNELNGAVCFHLSKGAPENVRVILMAPHYRALEHDDAGKVRSSSFYWSYVKKAYPNIESLFPLGYAASLSIGDDVVSFRGTLTLD